jgi:hypothetical protein
VAEWQQRVRAGACARAGCVPAFKQHCPSRHDAASQKNLIRLKIDHRMTSPTTSTSALRVIDFATHWLDEEGIIRPKEVYYATQCPKGHALVALADSGCSPAQQPLICRVCHTSAVTEQEASEWLACSVTRCCAGYLVCGCCIRQLQQPPAAAADGHGFVSLVRAAAQLRAFVTRRDAVSRALLCRSLQS